MASDNISPQFSLPRPTKPRPWLMAAIIYLLYALICLTMEGYSQHHVKELRQQRIALAKEQHDPVIIMPNAEGDLEKWSPYHFYSTVIGILTPTGAFALSIVCLLYSAERGRTGTDRSASIYFPRRIAILLIVPFFAGGFLIMAPRLFAAEIFKSVDRVTGSHYFF